MNNKFLLTGVCSLALLASAAPALATDQSAKVDARIKAKIELQDARKDFRDAREEFKEKKQEIRQNEGEEKGKAFLQQIITNMIQKLNNAKTWVQNRQGVSEADKNQALAQIEKELIWLQDKQAKLATMTKEEVKSTAKEIREHVQLTQKKVKRMVGFVIEKRVQQGVDKVNNIIAKVETKMTDLKAQGKNVSSYEARVATVKTQVTAANAKYQLAKDTYASIESKDNADELFKTARNYVEEGNKILHGAAVELKDVMHDMRVEFNVTGTATTTVH